MCEVAMSPEKELVIKGDNVWSEATTLNYWMMVEIYSNLKAGVGGSIHGCEIASLLESDSSDRLESYESNSTCIIPPQGLPK